MARIHTHPGAFLRDELEERGITGNALAIAIGVPAARISEILRERRAVTPDTAIRLAQYLGISAQTWLTMQAKHDLTKLEAEKGEVIRAQVRMPVQDSASA